MLNQNDVGAKIAVARKLRNLSQAQLAERLSVSAQAVGKWERGESMPDILLFARLAETLGTDLNHFAGMSPAPEITTAPAIKEDGDEPGGSRPGRDMSGSSWTDADFSGLSGLSGRLSGSNIDKCLFVESELAELNLRGNDIQRSDFSRSDLRRCNFRSSNLQQSAFVGCDFTGSEFGTTNVSDCDLSGANLTDVKAGKSSFKRLKLGGAALVRTEFSYSQLTEITFTGTLTECAFNNCDFARVVFEGVTFDNCFFKNVKLRRAKFVDCKADRVTYAFMKNCKADLSGVTIIGEGE